MLAQITEFKVVLLVLTSCCGVYGCMSIDHTQTHTPDHRTAHLAHNHRLGPLLPLGPCPDSILHWILCLLIHKCIIVVRHWCRVRRPCARSAPLYTLQNAMFLLQTELLHFGRNNFFFFARVLEFTVTFNWPSKTTTHIINYLIES